MRKEENSKEQGASTDWTKTAIMPACKDYQSNQTGDAKPRDEKTGLPDLEAAHGKTNYRTLTA